MGLDHVTIHIVAGCNEAREGLVLEPSRFVEGRRCGSGEWAHQMGVVAAGERAWAWFVYNFFLCFMCMDLADSNCAVPV